MIVRKKAYFPLSEQIIQNINVIASELSSVNVDAKLAYDRSYQNEITVINMF